MRSIVLALAAVTVILSTTALADDCDYINGKKICWESGSSLTLGWAYSKSSVGTYQIEARDFNWLGSVFIRVSHNSIVREGMLSEGESYIFDFTKDSGFEGIKIVADKISNVNPMPYNIGTYPNDPLAKITVKLPVVEKKKTPSLSVSITTEGETKAGSRIAAYIKAENSGDADLLDTELFMCFAGLKPVKEFDIADGFLTEATQAAPEFQWQNASRYRLTPFYPSTVSNGFLIRILNFSNSSVPISAGYNLSTKNGTLTEGGSIIFNFTGDKEYRGIKMLGSNFSESSAELQVQSPAADCLKRRYIRIFAGSSQTTKLSLLIPSSYEKTFTLSATANGKDGEGSVYSAEKSITIYASSTLGIKKSSTNSILGERLYPESYHGIRAIDNLTYVNIRVENLQSYTVYGVKLIDAVPPSFSLPEDRNRTSVSWDFDINAGEYKEFRYTLAAKRQGVYNLPKAELIWNEWGEEVHKESESPRTAVSGPYTGMERSFNNSSPYPGDVLQVTLSIINNGDIPTNITVKETVPRNATFLSGAMSFSGFLNPGETANIIYNISAPAPGTLEFKAPEMSSKNQGFEWYAQLPVKKLQVLSHESKAGIAVTAPAPVNTPAKVSEQGLVQMINERLPWLEGAVTITTFLFAIFLILTFNKKIA